MKIIVDLSIYLDLDRDRYYVLWIVDGAEYLVRVEGKWKMREVVR